ncbi:MAG: 50S ribosomal protein L1 [Alphaproteobacteria bacterium]|jgi:large subunit ribosomal protein L1|nr:50S ribosomal protein L1 [Alphaproteobacteria bacterium]
MSKNKRLNNIKKGLDLEAQYELDNAISTVKANATAKFDESVDVVFSLNVNPKHQDQNIREIVSMPEGLGKNTRVAVIAKAEKHEAAISAGAERVGAEDLVDEIRQGKVDFDFCIATPDMMPKVGQLGKILGPKGLMPNPKLGSVTNDVQKAVENAKKGQVELKVEKFGLVHAAIGKSSFDAQKIKNNFDAVYTALKNAKPTGVKGSYLKKVFIGSTMGPSLEISISSLNK